MTCSSLKLDHKEERTFSKVEKIDSDCKFLLTRRAVLYNSSRILNPHGFIYQVALQAKLLIKETWDNSSLGWHDPLPDELRRK